MILCNQFLKLNQADNINQADLYLFPELKKIMILFFK